MKFGQLWTGGQRKIIPSFPKGVLVLVVTFLVWVPRVCEIHQTQTSSKYQVFGDDWIGIVRWVGVTRSLSHKKKTWNFTNFSTPQHPSFTLRLNMISYLKNGGLVCTKKVPESLSSDRTFGTWKPFF